MYRAVVAIATSTATDAALSVVRMTGENCHRILEACLRKNREPLNLTRVADRRVTLCEFVHPDTGEILDRVTVILYRAPNSYTGEDLAELICHGGRGLTRAIFRILVQAGFTPAVAGEFTRRAFLNGKLDLAQAEAVAAATSASFALAARAAAAGLTGETSERIKSLADQMTEILSLLEANLDLSEEGIDVVDPDRIRSVLRAGSAALSELLRHADRSAYLSGAVRVAIIGKPNVGKSTLLNRLLGSPRAIVSPEPGTTRDVVDGRIEIDDVLFEFLDTAGLRGATDRIEAEGIERSRRAAGSADIIVFVLDASSIGEEDIDIAHDLPEKTSRILALNKTDLEPGDPTALSRLQGNGFKDMPTVRTVGTRPDGADSLRERISALGRGFLGDTTDTPVWISSRQAECLRRAKEAVERAITAAMAGELTEEFLSADIREALSALEDFAGRKTHDDVLDKIFSSFCVGK
ncbi:tRNA uridine-5-carboxymethylaminomethyl(34) synthesis GTPase MnmE [bacterium]|nr:tRNA uridine-5-carboxymethylaminomethyl(34) synthesis GTPase MnmE [bacterium]